MLKSCTRLFFMVFLLGALSYSTLLPAHIYFEDDSQAHNSSEECSDCDWSFNNQNNQVEPNLFSFSALVDFLVPEVTVNSYLFTYTYFATPSNLHFRGPPALV